MPVSPANFGLTGFSFPVTTCDYPPPSTVQVGVVYDFGMLVGTLGDATEPSGPHSPADVLRRLLIAMNLASDPPLVVWPCYTALEPPSPDNLITTYDTQGRDDGRIQIDGERVEHRGVQVRIRSITHTVGYAKAREIALALDQNVYDAVVPINTNQYLVHSITRTSDVIVMGKESPTSKRSLFTVNSVLSMKQLS